MIQVMLSSEKHLVDELSEGWTTVHLSSSSVPVEASTSSLTKFGWQEIVVFCGGSHYSLYELMEVRIAGHQRRS